MSMTETQPDLDALRAGLSEAAAACAPGEAGYDEAVGIWNAAIARRPSIVVRCASDSDVAAALAFARGSSLEVSVRGGGHNYAGLALTDGGVMIDLTPMKTVAVDPTTRRATCGGGTTWGELDAATQVHALAVTGGFISRTGVAGLTLGGGIGWLVRAIGLSCDNVVGARVVTADGQVRHATEAENSDLFWAIRGGGGNFGVVTEFEFALHPVGPMVQLGLFLFSPDQGRELFQFARDYVRDLPDECGVFLAGLSAPPAPFVPPELHLTPAFALLVVGLGDASSHARLLAPIRQSLQPTVELVTPIPYTGLQQMFDESAPWGMYSYEKAVYLDELADGAIDVILEHQARKMSPLSFVPIFVMGGAYRNADPGGTAFGGARNIGYVINISATTPSETELPAEREWVRNYWSALVEHAVGVGSYVNFMTEYDEERVRGAYGEKYARLQQIKATHDPANVFHLNVNIKPSARPEVVSEMKDP
jgi:FAD/FMN-containing dehydrogenase